MSERQIGAQLVEALPWSWEPDRRLQSSLDLYEAVVADDRYDESAREQLLEFCDIAERRYVIPGHAARMLDATIFGLPKGEIGEHRSQLETVQTDDEHKQLMRRFEQEVLGLTPNRSRDGLRWFESNAGFDSGTYSIAPIARLVGMSVVDMTIALGDQSGRVMLRSDNLVVNVHKHPEGKMSVNVSNVIELTPLGSAVLEATLGAYAIGLRS